MTIGDRKYVSIPGDDVLELPPLLLKDPRGADSPEDVLVRARTMIANDWLIHDEAGSDPTGLAVNLAERYGQFLNDWTWGESILEWIRQCETTFEARPRLRGLLRPDVWPHAGRSSFVTLLADKAVPHEGVVLENAMGLRLTFRQPPPIQFFSDKFLFFLNPSIASNAYRTWADASGEEAASLPPERFRFFVSGTDIREV